MRPSQHLRHIYTHPTALFLTHHPNPRCLEFAVYDEGRKENASSLSQPPPVAGLAALAVAVAAAAAALTARANAFSASAP